MDTLRGWYRRDEVDQGHKNGVTTQERQDVRTLKAKVRRLEEDSETSRPALTRLRPESRTERMSQHGFTPIHNSNSTPGKVSRTVVTCTISPIVMSRSPGATSRMRRDSTRSKRSISLRSMASHR